MKKYRTVSCLFIVSVLLTISSVLLYQAKRELGEVKKSYTASRSILKKLIPAYKKRGGKMKEL